MAKYIVIEDVYSAYDKRQIEQNTDGYSYKTFDEAYSVAEACAESVGDLIVRDPQFLVSLGTDDFGYVYRVKKI